MSIVGLRRRLALVLAVVAALCLLTLGVACVCTPGHHSGQTVEQTISSIPVVAVPLAVVGIWFALLLALPAAVVLLERRRFGFGRASPVLLQRFLL